MDLIAFAITVIICSLALFGIGMLLRRRLAEVEDVQESRRQNEAPQEPMRAEAETAPSYGPIDCYDDCMRVFRWQAKEEAECAQACGLRAR
jgi:hypothetical protein